jgi:hypothetical protein
MPVVNVTGTFTSTSYASGALVFASVQVLQKAAFVGILAPLSGLSPGSHIWSKDPIPFISPLDAAVVYLTVRSIKTRGIDDLRPDVTAGDRDLCVTIRAEAFNLSVEASEILNRILTGLQRPSTNLLLGNIGLSYMKNGGMAEISYQIDNRAVNAAIADVFFNGIINDFPGVDPSGNIATVNTNNIVPGVISF